MRFSLRGWVRRRVPFFNRAYLAALRERAAIQERRVAAEAAFMARIRAEHTEVVTPDVIARWVEETK